MRPAVASESALWRRALIASAGVLACGVIGAAPAFAAPPDQPPNCTGGDFAGITAGVAAAMSAYLFTHPEVNAYVTDLESVPRGESVTRLVDYESAHPTVRAELAAIRQPLVDFDTRCGYGTEGGVA
ncbi:hypothetical protein BH09ACT8_BH09ACT8_33480 [soil metagenome]